ncbi:MAG TPA: AMP-binding protein, partial [Candidatus Anoxymicrobiaceae bacterium]
MSERFWTKSYDPGLTDLDPSAWETTYVDAVKPIFSKFPDKAALAFLGVEVSFKDLDIYANRFADMLIVNGFEKGDVVGINLPNIPEYVVAWLGTLRAGCVVSGVSPLLSAEEMEYQLADSNARGLVTLDAIFEGRLVGIASGLPNLKLVATASVGGFLPGFKRVLGQLLKKIPKGKVTPIDGKTVVDMKKAISDRRYATAPPDVAL